VRNTEFIITCEVCDIWVHHDGEDSGPCSLHLHLALKMKTAWSPETLASCRNTARRHNSESQMHPDHTLPPYECFPKIRSNIILLSALSSSEWYLSLMFPYQIFVLSSHLHRACCMSRPSYPPWLDHPNNTWWSIKVMELVFIRNCLCRLINRIVFNGFLTFLRIYN
jgi:hypothetical protein